MACRKISDNFGTMDIVAKTVTIPDSWDKDIIFPSIEHIKYEDGALQRFLNTIPGLQNSVRQAIIQQYNEYFIYSDEYNTWRNILAPQLGIVFNSYNLPILLYPRFEPLVDEDTVWKTNDHICMIYAGQHLKDLGVSMEEIKTFYDEVKEFCAEYGLVEDDIIKNPSNIGYNKVLGLRLIDYGLAEDDKLVTDA